MNGQFKCLAAMALTAVVSLPARGQEAERPQRQRPMAGMREGGAVDLVSRLDEAEKRVMELLTDEQKKQAEPLFKKAREQVKALQADLEAVEAQRRQIMEKAAEQTGKLREEVAALLTDDQKQKLREAVGGMAGAAGGQIGGMMQQLQEGLKQLDLNDEQKQKLAVIRDEMQGKMQKLRESTAGDRQAMAQGVRELMQDLRAKLMEVLTPEQQEKLRGTVERGGGAGGERRERGPRQEK